MADDTVSFDPNVIGFLAVDAADGKDITSRGYVCSICKTQNKREPPPGQDTCHTSRNKVPYATNPVDAVANFRKHRPNVDYTTVLQLLRKAKDGSELPADQVLKDKILPDTDTFVLDKKFIDTAVVMERGPADYEGTPCPICGDELTGKKGEVGKVGLYGRGKVGLYAFIKNAFMVTPCEKDTCIQMQVDRQKRLDTMPKMKLYHACSRDIAELIKGKGGKMIRGVGGAGGGGIYLAHTVRECEWKAEIKLAGEYKGQLKKFKASNTQVAVLEVEAKLGNMYLGSRNESKNFGELLQTGFDSCILDRAGTGYPDNKVPDAPVNIDGKSVMGGTHPGYEFVVYSWDQVKVLREVPRDPVPGMPDAIYD